MLIISPGICLLGGFGILRIGFFFPFKQIWFLKSLWCGDVDGAKRRLFWAGEGAPEGKEWTVLIPALVAWGI